MSSSKLLVIVGITGNQGSAVANTFLNTPGWHIRGITRDPSSAAALAWTAKGIELVKATLDDISSLEHAFSGATAIFAVTDFWVHYYNPANIPKATEAGVSMNEYARDLETAHGMNVALAASSPAVSSTLTHYIFSTLSDTTGRSKGKYTSNFHFDSKAAVTLRIQKELPGLAAKLSTVQVGMYADNWKRGIGRTQQQSDGSLLVYIPEGDATPIPWVVAHRDTGVFVKALLQHEPGKHVLGCSEMTTFREFWGLWADIKGVKVEMPEVPLGEYLKPLPEPMRKEMYDSLSYIWEFGYTGGDPEVRLLADLAPEAKTTSMREYIETEDWSSFFASM
ncbi:hypothetical protein EDB80DRAFT_730717 [Ilyonectria destructans]|nr:hypothetical protein EDB80DRAFT_730717 [Ilyonectria destructans]